MLALQGAFARHVEALKRCGADAFEVRTAQQLERCQALVLPGGESTTMLNLLATFELIQPLGKLLADGLPTFGTCAGMILLARSVSDGRHDQTSFGAIDIDVRRNGYGRQIDSFEAELDVPALDFVTSCQTAPGQPAPGQTASGGADGGSVPLAAVFIRAPMVERVGQEVEVLASHDDVPVLCRQGPVLVSSFHPELVDDDRLHRLFLSGVPKFQ